MTAVAHVQPLFSFGGHSDPAPPVANVNFSFGQFQFTPSPSPSTPPPTSPFLPAERKNDPMVLLMPEDQELDALSASFNQVDLRDAPLLLPPPTLAPFNPVFQAIQVNQISANSEGAMDLKSDQAETKGIELKHGISRQRAKQALQFLQQKRPDVAPPFQTSPQPAHTATTPLFNFGKVTAPTLTSLSAVLAPIVAKKPPKSKPVVVRRKQREQDAIINEDEDAARMAIYQWSGFSKYGIRLLLNSKLEPQEAKPHQQRIIDRTSEIERNPPCGIPGVGTMWVVKMGLGKTLSAKMKVLKDRMSKRMPIPNVTPEQFAERSRPLPHIHPKADLLHHPTLVVAPLGLVDTWVESIQRFFGIGPVKYLLFGTNWMTDTRLKNITYAELKTYDFVITNYDFLVGQYNREELFKQYVKEKNEVLPPEMEADLPTWLAKIKANGEDDRMRGPALMYWMHWLEVIYDESDHFANYETQFFYAAVALKAFRRVALTGTPYRNCGDDYYAQFRALGFHKLTSPAKWNQKVFLDFKLDQHMIVVDYADAGIVLPPTRMEIIYVKRMHPEEIAMRNLFIEMCDNAVGDYDRKKIKAGSILGLLTRLRQESTTAHSMLMDRLEEKKQRRQQAKELKGKALDDAPEIKVVRQIEHLFGTLRLRPTVRTAWIELGPWMEDRNGTAGKRSSKMQKLVEVVKMMPKGCKMLVFSKFVSQLEIAKEALTEAGERTDIYDGSLNGQARTALLQTFENTPEFKTLLLSLGPSAKGLNLQCANFEVFLDVWWSPALEEQAHHRVVRMGQTKPTFIIRLLVEDSVDSSIIKLGHRKQAEAHSWKTGAELDISSAKKIDILRDWIKVVRLEGQSKTPQKQIIHNKHSSEDDEGISDDEDIEEEEED